MRLRGKMMDPQFFYLILGRERQLLLLAWDMRLPTIVFWTRETSTALLFKFWERSFEFFLCDCIIQDSRVVEVISTVYSSFQVFILGC